MTNEEAVKIVSQYNPSLEYVKACDKIKQMQQENQILKEGVKALRKYVDIDKVTCESFVDRDGSITPEFDYYDINAEREMCSDLDDTKDDFNKIKAMMEVVDNGTDN